MSPSAEPRPAPSRLEFAEHGDGDRRTLALAGELDLASSPAFNERIGEVLGSDEPVVAFDLRALTFIDSSGLHGLLNAHRRLTRQGRRFEVICTDGPVLRAIQLARLVETLGVRLDG